jgi:hypothetical protein
MKQLKKTHLLLVLIVSLFVMLQPVRAEDAPPPPATPNYNTLLGEWQRTDGNYLIKVSDIQKDGSLQVNYFNPKPIHVAEAALSTQKELIKLFIKFQDKGYEGSTYTLFYYGKKDALVGFYYQAVMDKTFEVIFTRKPKIQNN